MYTKHVHFNNGRSLTCVCLCVCARGFLLKTACLYLPLCVIAPVADLQCWVLTRSRGGEPCSSHWASPCSPPLWFGSSSALYSRRRLNVSYICVSPHFLMTHDFFFHLSLLLNHRSFFFFTWAILGFASHTCLSSLYASGPH